MSCEECIKLSRDSTKLLDNCRAARAEETLLLEKQHEITDRLRAVNLRYLTEAREFVTRQFEREVEHAAEKAKAKMESAFIGVVFGVAITLGLWYSIA